MSPELQERLLTFFESCDAFKGKKLRIHEYISTFKDNFDRHFTTSSVLEFKLTSFGVRFSGARAMYMGDVQSYEIGVDHIIEFKENGENQFELLEKYSESVYRKTHLHFFKD